MSRYIDADKLMQALDKKTNAMIERLENDLEDQNKMLKEILDIMKGEKNGEHNNY